MGRKQQQRIDGLERALAGLTAEFNRIARPEL